MEYEWEGKVGNYNTGFALTKLTHSVSYHVIVVEQRNLQWDDNGKRHLQFVDTEIQTSIFP